MASRRPFISLCAIVALLAPVTAFAASAGLAVVIANDYDGYLPGALRDANAIADRLEANGLDSVRLLGLPGSAIAAGVEQVHKAAASAGPLRLVYATGFGMCLNDDLVLFAEDMQPEQFKSGQLGDTAVPLSILAGAAGAGGEHTLVVFDTNPTQCTTDSLEAMKRPETATLLVTTAIGGDVMDDVDGDGHSAFSAAFLKQFRAKTALKDVLDQVVAEIRDLTDNEQMPIVIGEFE